MKELLAPSNPYKPNKLEGEGCYKCDAKRCDSSKNFLIFGNSFRAAATGRIFLILKYLTCTSSNVVYLAECVLCGLQGVGSTANFKSRLANYKSHIKHKRRTCSITNHFIDVHEADHSSLKFMLIDQHHSEVLKIHIYTYIYIYRISILWMTRVYHLYISEKVKAQALSLVVCHIYLFFS